MSAFGRNQGMSKLLPPAPDQPLTWRKSTRSGGNSDMCVEVALTDDGARVRDSEDPNGPVLEFTRGQWDAFLAGVADGEFSHA